MRDVVKKMNHQFTKAFPRDNIFLTANVAKPALDYSSAVKAILFFPFRRVGHNKFFLNVSTKIQVPLCFSLLNNSSTFDP